MLVISLDETVPHQYMIDGSWILPPSEPKVIYFCQQPRISDVPTAHRAEAKPHFYRNIFAASSIFNPCRCLRYIQTKIIISACEDRAFEFPVPMLVPSIWPVLLWVSCLTKLSDVWPRACGSPSFYRVRLRLCWDKTSGMSSKIQLCPEVAKNYLY